LAFSEDPLDPQIKKDEETRKKKIQISSGVGLPEDLMDFLMILRILLMNLVSLRK